MPEAWTKPPRGQGERQQEIPAADPFLDKEREERQWNQGSQKHEGLEPGGVEEGDDADSDEVIHHCKGQQESPERGGQMCVDDGQHCEGEGDVRGGGGSPSL